MLEEGMKCPDEVVVLDLSDRGITEISLDILCFDNLEELILDNNPELTTLPEELEYMPMLRKLSMAGCNAQLLYCLSVLPELEELRISGMFLPDADVLHPVTKLKNLRKLDMSGCCATNPYSNKDSYFRWRLPEELGNLLRLEWLSLDECYLEKLPVSLRFLTNLTYLSVKNNYIEQIPDDLRELDALKAFYTQGNPLKRRKAKGPGTEGDRGNTKSVGVQQPLLVPEVIKELNRLNIRVLNIDIAEKWFTVPGMEGEEESVIPSPLVQLLWGFNWKGQKLFWKELPFRSLEISYLFYLEESFVNGGRVFLCIGCFESEGQAYRLTVSLTEDNWGNPVVYLDDYEAEEPSYLDSLSGLLERLTT